MDSLKYNSTRPRAIVHQVVQVTLELMHYSTSASCYMASGRPGHFGTDAL